VLYSSLVVYFQMLLICLSNKNYCNLKPKNYCNIFFFDNLLNFAGFEQTHISLYFHYLVAHPHIARAFNKLSFDHKLIWARNFVSEKFPGVWGQLVGRLDGSFAWTRSNNEMWSKYVWILLKPWTWYYVYLGVWGQLVDRLGRFFCLNHIKQWIVV
jgi:hypothetical protein